MNHGILYPRSTGIDLDLGLTKPLLGIPQIFPTPYHLPKNSDWLLGNSDGSSSENYAIVIDTTKGTSTTITLVVYGGNLGSIDIDWGDGTHGALLPAGNMRRTGSYETRIEFTGAASAISLNHTYAKHGIYTITATGKFNSVNNNALRIPTNLIAVLSYGNSSYTFLTQTDSTNLIYVPPFLPTGIVSLSSAFQNCTSFNHSNIGYWDTSRINSMLNTFNSATNFIGVGLENWNVGSVTTFNATFNACSSLGSGIVLNLSNWDTSQATNMTSMFASCTSLSNTIISGWYGASGCIHTTQFNLSNLSGAYLPNWKFIGSSNCNGMFTSCNLADASGLETWNTSGVTNMTNMFRLTTNMQHINFSGWNVSRVTTMNGMFSQNSVLSGSGIENWNLAGLNSSTSLTNFANTATISSGQYDLILNTWAANTGAVANGVANWRTDLAPHFGTSKYTAAGSGARAALVAYGWTITDGGLQT
jgi:surface protein